MSARVIVTGSRDWTDRGAVRRALAAVADERGWPGMTVVHGACSTGADVFASQWARDVLLREERWPADWERFGRAAGPRRNAAMVAAGADLVLAFPLGRSYGTRGCMRLAAAAGIEVRVIAP